VDRNLDPNTFAQGYVSYVEAAQIRSDADPSLSIAPSEAVFGGLSSTRCCGWCGNRVQDPSLMLVKPTWWVLLQEEVK
jgi:hypothetical protein